MSAGQRYRNLRHYIAIGLYDNFLDDMKVQEIEDKLDYFFSEACVILLGGEIRIDAKDIS